MNDSAHLPSRGNILPSFTEAFERYSVRTDGKEKIAEHVGRIARELNATALLDLGAGDGRLTRLLGKYFERILAVERNDGFRETLAQIPNVAVICSAMETYIPDSKFDVALMSYSLSGVPLSALATFVGGLLASRSEGGKILFTTYRDGCAWDLFSDEVYSDLDLPRTGGASRHRMELKDAGFEVRSVCSFDTLIWDASVPELANTLAFFYYKKIGDYSSRLPHYIEQLEKYCVNLGDGRVAIPVVEEIFEILPT